MQDTIVNNPDALPSRADEEDIRLTTGFADIFTAIMLIVGASTIGTLAGGFGAIIICAAAFVLGRPLIQTRQFAASAIALTLCISVGTVALTADTLGIGALIIATVVTGAYWKVYKVPIAFAATFVAAVLFIIVLDPGDIGDIGEPSPIRAILAGTILFGAALYCDAKDRLRQTRMSDVAFWLHLAAAPFIVHGLFTILGYQPFQGEMASSIPVFSIFAVLTFISLIIDRRPILVSTLSYLFAALYQLGSNAQPTIDGAAYLLNAAIAPGIIGIGILFLAAGWTPLRRALIGLLPDKITMYVPAASGDYTAPVEDRSALPIAETEPLRLVLGFNDFFVAIGCVSLCTGMIVLGLSLAVPPAEPNMDNQLTQLSGWRPWLPVLLPAVSMWLAAEYFVRNRRMAWPAVTTAFWFAIMTIGVSWLVTKQYWGDGSVLSLFSPNGPGLSYGAILGSIITACLIAFTLNLLFWRRHRVPVSFAFAIAMLIPLFFVDTIYMMTTEDTQKAYDTFPTYRFIIAGVLIFAGAMWWDRRDTARLTQRADTAFWMHLLAALLYVPALFMSVLKDIPVAIILAFIALIIGSLTIDRRGPLAVALPFTIAGLGSYLGASGGAIVGLILASLLLALSLYWDKARSSILSILQSGQRFKNITRPTEHLK